MRIGAFQIARKCFESDVWRLKPASWFKIWVYIIGNAQHDDFKELKRGQGYFNFRDLIRMKVLGEDVTYGMVDKFMRYAKGSRMLSTSKSTHGVLITVRNYSQYQNLNNYRVEWLVDKPVEVKSKRSRNEVDNIKEEWIRMKKNEKNGRAPARITKKYSSLQDLGETEFQETAARYQVPIAFVRSEYDSLVNYCEAHGRRYQNYLAALRNFVKRDAIQIRKEVSEHVSKRGIDARHIK